MFQKVLIANRGEIAVRIIRTLHEMGIAAVAVYSEADRRALHVRLADEAIPIGPADVSASYLRLDRILDAAKQSGADALHPGYGFLSENIELANACEAAGITFIGPPADAIRAMGSKTDARARMIAAGVPVVPGKRTDTPAEAVQAAAELGYPIMIKAAMGGGGKGMRLVHAPAELEHAFERAASEALAAFGDGTVYLEKAILRPRHVEIQLLGDKHGHIVHLYERDCSIQRRHQKVVEETPCPSGDDALIAEMGRVAVQAAKAVGYHSAGTVEFLLDEKKQFYFLEMNTRLQVEHPITEWITGIDLVREMVRVAAGEKLEWTQETLSRHGAAMECRVYAEDPVSGFLPSPGTIQQLQVPAGPFIRDDSGVVSGSEISSHYDPLISKLSVWAPTRAQAIARMRRALREYVVTGIRTNLDFHQRLMDHPDFVAGDYDTGFIGKHKEALTAAAEVPETHARDLAIALALRAAAKDGDPSRRTGEQRGEAVNGTSMSPWVATHRVRQLR